MNRRTKLILRKALRISEISTKGQCEHPMIFTVKVKVVRCRKCELFLERGAFNVLKPVDKPRLDYLMSRPIFKEEGVKHAA